jgi:3D (Asp-Asp-Asp) domain-containing protein
MRTLALVVAACVSGAACVTVAGQSWVAGEEDDMRRREHRGWSQERPARSVAEARAAEDHPPDPLAPPKAPEEAAEVVAVEGGGSKAKGPAFRNGERFRNTYYDFPREDKGDKDAALYDARCNLIANVTRDFHDRVCVQGSGRLGTGETVSFAKRDCDCAALCPRTGQKICFERLDPARFPTGRGALGKAITPLRTVAVDSTVIPLGTVLFIPEFRGLDLPDGSRHDGCFVAEDRGMKVTGRQIDVFTGDPALTARLNTIVPSNQGVRVHADDPRCTTRRL